jgi:hypothetical protein
MVTLYPIFPEPVQQWAKKQQGDNAGLRQLNKNLSHLQNSSRMIALVINRGMVFSTSSTVS